MPQTSPRHQGTRAPGRYSTRATRRSWARPEFASAPSQVRHVRRGVELRSHEEEVTRHTNAKVTTPTLGAEQREVIVGEGLTSYGLAVAFVVRKASSKTFRKISRGRQ